MKTVIVKKVFERLGGNPNVGYLLPVYEITDSGGLVLISPDKRTQDFPNAGTIVVLKNYENIHLSYSKDELFVVGYEPCVTFDNKEKSSKYQYVRGTSTAEKLPLFVKMNIDDLSNTIKLPYPDHQYIFIESVDYVYGPISVQMKTNDSDNYNNFDDDEGGYEGDALIDSEYEYDVFYLTHEDLQEISLSKEYVNTYFRFGKSQLLKYIVNQQKRDGDNFFYNFKEAIRKQISNFNNQDDFVVKDTDEEIIKWAKGAIPQGSGNENYDKWLTTLNPNSIVNQIRLERFLKIKDKTTKWSEFLDFYLKNKYFTTKEGDEKIAAYVKTNRGELLKDFDQELKKEAKEKNKELAELESENENLLNKKRVIENEIEDLKEIKEILRSNNKEVSELDEKIAQRKKELNVLDDLNNLNVENAILRREHDRINKDIHIAEDRLNTKKQELEELERQYFKKAKDGAHEKVLELIPFVRAINFETRVDNPKSKQTLSENVLKMFNKEPFSQIDEYVGAAKSFLKENNREFSTNEVINLLVNLNQNFLTVLVGIPGVGKTSLANLMSSFITSDEFSLEIPVARGWNSRKNLLGYYNPLKLEYQPDEFGLVEKLIFCNKTQDALTRIPFIITLDEANLSQIEYYWSDFINLSDKEGRRLLKMNDIDDLYLPDGCRFIFTVNSDHTTELLSPRLIDRASIIKINYDPKNEPNFSPKQNRAQNEFYSQEILKSQFCPDKYELSSQEKKILSDIIAVLTDDAPKFGKQIAVSPRKNKIITQYCSVARNIFKFYHDNQLLALDYAVLQNILPLINGNGKDFLERLLRLKEECSNRSLSKSAQEVEKIIAKGKEFQNFNYFSL